MRRSSVVLIASLLVLTGAASDAGAAEEDCMIGDAALCLAAPNCWWDNQRRGCYPGEAPAVDRCAAHEQKGICDTSSLNCRWSEANDRCESKPEE